MNCEAPTCRPPHVCSAEPRRPLLSGGSGRRPTMRAGTCPRGSHYSLFPTSHRQCQTAPRSSGQRGSPSLAAAPATCSTERGTGMRSPGTPWSLATPGAVTSAPRADVPRWDAGARPSDQVRVRGLRGRRGVPRLLLLVLRPPCNSRSL